MSSPFQRAIALVLQHEGGYANDPRDAGGETNHGISKRAYPNEDIRSLTVERATQLYERDYWKPLCCDQLPWGLAVQVFDHGVNAGLSSATKLLQRVLGVLDDGVIGPLTLEKAQIAGRGHVISYARRRIRYYAGLNQFPTFGDSWTQRTLETLIEAVT